MIFGGSKHYVTCFAGFLLLTACTESEVKPAASTKQRAALAAVEVHASVERGMRRLTAVQYQNIIRDLFGPTIELGGRFEPELRVDGLLAVGSSEVSITAGGMEQFDAMARRIAAQLVDEKRRERLPCSPADVTAADDVCTRQVVLKIAPLIYRRPLSDGEVATYVNAARVATAETKDFYDGLSLTISAMLSSPSFLFRQVSTEPQVHGSGAPLLDSFSLASELSFFLWNSGPDALLFEAASKGRLRSKEGLALEVDRMLESSRVEAGVRAFFTDMLEFELFETLSKDAAIFPKFSRQAIEDAQEETLRTIVNVVLVQNGDYRDIFTTKKTFLTKQLAAIYRVPLVSDVPNGAPETWEPFEYGEDDPRGGILTQMSFTALHSPAGRASATLRGKAIREVLMCQRVPPPPGAVEFNIVEDTTNPQYRTARDRLNAHATNPVCAGCHKIVDPMGYALENFDGGGAFRTTESGALIDASGTLDGVGFKTPAELGSVLHDNKNTAACLVKRLASYAVGRPLKDERWLGVLQQRFIAEGFRLRPLMRAIVLSDSFATVAGGPANMALTRGKQSAQQEAINASR